MLSRLQATLAEHGLLRPGDRVVVAVSGGADSMALLYALHALARRRRLSLVVAHLHHGIRGAAADRDAAFVRAAARRLWLPFVFGRAAVPALARRRRVSVEMAAREARYAFLARVVCARRAACAAVAHTADDQAETVLLKLARGAGPQGLAGIPYHGTVHGCPVVRPLLDVTRAEARAFLGSRRRKWIEDETNRDPAYLRVRVRDEVLPLLAQRLNPAIREALVRTAAILRAENGWLDELARGILECCRTPERLGLSAERLRQEPLAAERRVLRLWLTELGVQPEALEFETVERVRCLLAARGPRSVCLGPRLTVRRSAGVLAADAPPARPFAKRLRVPGETPVPEAGVRVFVDRATGWSPPPHRHPGRLPAETWIATATLRGRALTVRSIRPGDRFRALGAPGSRKVQDILVDAKLPRDQRARLPVIACGRQLVWIPGHRIAEGWQLPSPSAPSLHLRVAPLL
jgi:tRNA(Ile)-lysidine synthase